MGSAASIELTTDLSAEQVGDIVSKLGPRYKVYKAAIMKQNINGRFLASFVTNKDQLDIVLDELQITKEIHREQILIQLQKAGLIQIDGNNDNDILAKTGSPYKKNNEIFQMKDSLMTSPRDLMTKMFSLQAIKVNLSEMHIISEKIANEVIKRRNNNKKFDCFISYRVASDSVAALLIYYSLISRNITVFLDKVCLEIGYDWKTGFLNGLL